MARSLQEIKDQMILVKSNEPELAGLTSASKTAIWMLLIYIVAFGIWTLENIFDLHNTEVDKKISLLKPHTLRWYRQMTLAFQYGFSLQEDSPFFENGIASEDEIEASKIIKYSAVTESEDESRLIIKIATEQESILSPVNELQYDAFKTYLQEFKDAGTKVTVINYLPDRLRLKIRIVRDALILDVSGLNRLTGEMSINIALQEFMKELPFDGQLSIQKLEAKLLNVSGVKDLNIDIGETSWIDATANNYGDWQAIDIAQIPISGYFSVNLEDQNDSLTTIEYV